MYAGLADDSSCIIVSPAAHVLPSLFHMHTTLVSENAPFGAVWEQGWGEG